MRVLVVEDERKLAQVLASALEGEHYDVVVARTGEDGFFRANAEVFASTSVSSRATWSRRWPSSARRGV